MEGWLIALGVIEPGHTSEWISGFWGAAGAIAGSLVTIVWTEYVGQRTRKRERKERFAAAAFTFYQKLNSMYSATLQVCGYMRTRLLMAARLQAETGAPLCVAVRGMNRLLPPVHFSNDELWTLTQLGGTKLINRVNSLDQSFNSLLDVFERYERERDEIWRELPPPFRMEGWRGTIDPNIPEVAALLPRMRTIDYLLVQISPFSESLISDLFEALSELTQVKSRPLGAAFSIQIPNPEGEWIGIKAPKFVRWWPFNPKRSEEGPSDYARRSAAALKGGICWANLDPTTAAAQPAPSGKPLE